MGSYKAFFIQMQPNFISDLKLVWHLVLIMEFLVLGIGHIQNIMNLLVDVLNSFNQSSGFVDFSLRMGRLCLCGHKG
jgi:hypothetical protein